MAGAVKSLTCSVGMVTAASGGTIDTADITSDAVTFAKMQAVSADVSARNLMATAGTISPGLGLGTSLLTSAADIGSMWARNKRIEELLSGVSTQRT